MPFYCTLLSANFQHKRLQFSGLNLYTGRMKFWHEYHYKNLTLVGISLIIAIYLLQNDFFRNILLHLGGWGYLGAFLAGMLFVSTFTVSIGTVILFILSNNHLSPLEIAIFAGIGSVVSDFIIFQSIRSRDLMDEIRNVFNFLGGARIQHLIKTKYFSWTLPVIGAIIIATPLPDELGVSLLGISHMSPSRFLLLSFILNFTGIFLIITAAKAL